MNSTQLTPHRGVVILVLGILSLLLCFVFGIAAWVMGNADLKQMDAGLMDPEGRGLTQAGKLCGIIGLALNLILICLSLFLVFFAAGASAVSHM
ncbi:MAG: hypothetical protein CMJ84_06040 [Planctomycetes bacterium]|jgi:hypothetical protein|nr:hypothetical protein [Planctomycetota bacterium]MDP6409410.1 DUF4190 domain-containing protein [Planctomycetota bacterium]